MTELAPAAAPVVARASPYQGLMHYECSDEAYFFGRETERKIVAANLIASRLTLVYGPSGVGKSSLLRAGVQRDLLELARTRREAKKHVDHLVVVYNGPWHGDPISGLDNCIRQAVQDVYGIDAPVPADVPQLDELLARWTDDLGAQLLVVLDQFEEYLLYADGPAGRRLDRELPLAICRADLDVGFLISIREDGIADLDRFKGRIPNLFENYLRIDHLDRDAGRRAIRGPIDRWNVDFRSELPPVEIDDDLVETVLDQVRTGRVVVGTAGRGKREENVDDRRTTDRIETPHLQLVLEKLWSEELDNGSTRLRRSTLDALGGASQIVLTRGRDAIAALPREDQDVLATIFDRLVTPSGAKIAHAVDDLAKWARTTPAELTPILEQLCGGDLRILRRVAPPPGAPGGMRYELFHDVLGKAILDWQARYEHERSETALAERLEAEALERAKAEEHAEHERRIARRALRTSIAAGAAALVAVAFGVFAFVALHDANEAKRLSHAQELAANAEAELAVDPHVSVFLAAKAAKQHTPITEAALRDAVDADRVLSVTRVGRKSLDAAVLSPERGRVLVETGNRIEVRDLRTHRLLRRIGGAKKDDIVASSLSAGAPRALIVNGGRARIWSLAPVTAGPEFPKPDFTEDAWSFSDDGSRLALGVGRSVEIRDGRTGALRRRIPLPIVKTILTGDAADIASVYLSGRGGLVLVEFEGGGVGLYRTATGAQVGRIVHGDFWVLAGAIADGGGTVAFGGLDGLVRLWKPLRRTVIPLRGHADTVTTVALSPNGKLLVTAGDDGTPRVWDAATGAPVAQLNGHVGSVGGASFSPDSREVVTIGDATARVWDALSGASIAVLRGHNPAAAPAVTSAGFDRDGKRILTGGSDGTYRLWDALPRRLTFVHPAAVTDAVVSPDGSLVLTAAEDGSARLWETSTGRLARAKREAEFPSPLTAAAFAPDGRTFAVASSDILVWPPNGSEQDLFIQAGKDTYLTPTDVAFPPGWHGNAAHVTILAASDHRRAAIWFSTGDNDPRALQTFRHRGAVMTAAYSPDGRRVLTASRDGTARVWSVASGKPLLTLRGDKGFNAAAYSPDGNRVLTASRDGTARVWSVASGKPLLTLRGDKGFNAAAYSSNGKRILTAGADRVGRIWDARTGKELLELAGHTKALTSAAFSPDGSRVVTASNDKTARVWDARTGKLIAVLTDATGPVTSAAFGPGGRTLVTASADGKARLYPWRSFAPFARLLRVAAQDERVPLTPWERVEYDTLAAS